METQLINNLKIIYKRIGNNIDEEAGVLVFWNRGSNNGRQSFFTTENIKFKRIDTDLYEIFYNKEFEIKLKPWCLSAVFSNKLYKFRW